jgi:hypothetical protein
MAGRAWRAGLTGLTGLMGLLGLAACGDDAGYGRKAGRWMHEDTAVNVADPRSFQPLDARFARDAVQGYYRGQPVAGSHGPSFEALSEHEARDRHAVYWADTYRKAQEYWAWRHVRVSRVAGADPVRYQVLAHGYARDGLRAYFEGQAFAVADAASFAPLDTRFARDARSGYFERVAIAGSDGTSFTLLDPDTGTHARDRSRVYSAHIELNQPLQPPHPVVRVLQGARPETTRVAGQGYAVDGAHVWWRGRMVADADAGSFEVLAVGGDADARDARSHFREGRRQADTLARAATN